MVQNRAAQCIESVSVLFSIESVSVLFSIESVSKWYRIGISSVQYRIGISSVQYRIGIEMVSKWYRNGIKKFISERNRCFSNYFSTQFFHPFRIFFAQKFSVWVIFFSGKDCPMSEVYWWCYWYEVLSMCCTVLYVQHICRGVGWIPSRRSLLLHLRWW